MAGAVIISVFVPLAVVIAFVAVAAACRRMRLPAAVSPVLVTAVLAGAVLAATGTPLARFAALAAPLRLALDPAIVALGAGVYANRRALLGWPTGVAIAVGAATGIGSALGLAHVLGLGPLLTAASATRTISTAFAVLVQARVGGPIALGAGLAVGTGVIGAIILPPLFAALGIRDRATVGIAIGVAAHLVGTDAVARRDATTGGFAGAALAGVGILVALVVPPLWPWLVG